jgi:hypothetical protein
MSAASASANALSYSPPLLPCVPKPPEAGITEEEMPPISL